MRPGRDAWMLAVLLVAFIAATTYYARRGFETQQSDQPTTYNVGPAGMKGLLELYRRQNVPCERYERSWASLPDNASVLIVTEPIERQPKPDEIAALQRWVDRGGTVLVLAGTSGTRLARDKFPMDGIDVVSSGPATATVTPDEADSTLFADVASLSLTSPVRLVNKDEEHQDTRLEDPAGPAIVSYLSGNGAVIVAADSLGLANAGLGQADDAVLALNLPRLAAGRNGVLFDEYHQGFGAEQGASRPLWQAIGAPYRAVVWYGLGLFGLFVLSSNRRFGTARRLLAPSYRPSTEYIGSMAALYRRAGRPEIPIEGIFRAFIRDLASRLGLDPDTPAEELVRRGAKQFGWDETVAREIAHRCERIVAGERCKDSELVRIAQQIQTYRRTAELDRFHE